MSPIKEQTGERRPMIHKNGPQIRKQQGIASPTEGQKPPMPGRRQMHQSEEPRNRMMNPVAATNQPKFHQNATSTAYGGLKKALVTNAKQHEIRLKNKFSTN
jgi:hypothetical protein